MSKRFQPVRDCKECHRPFRPDLEASPPIARCGECLNIALDTHFKFLMGLSLKLHEKSIEQKQRALDELERGGE